jgi:hypothetical protein
MIEWISVKDRLPETKYGTWSKEDCLLLTLYNYEIGRTKDGEWVDMNNDALEDVTHWMPLPKPPKE